MKSNGAVIVTRAHLFYPLISFNVTVTGFKEMRLLLSVEEGGGTGSSGMSPLLSWRAQIGRYNFLSNSAWICFAMSRMTGCKNSLMYFGFFKVLPKNIEVACLLLSYLSER